MNGMDIELVKSDKEVVQATKSASNFLQLCRETVVINSENPEVKIMRVAAKEKVKEAKAMYSRFFGGAEEFVKMGKAMFKPTIDAYDEGDDILKAAQEKARRAEVEAAAKENRRRQEAIDKETKSILAKDIRELVKVIGASEAEVITWMSKGRAVKIASLDTKDLSILDVAAMETIKKMLVERAERKSPEAAKKIEKIAERELPVEPAKVEVKKEGFRKVPRMRILNESLIPEKYWVIDQVSLRTDVLDGIFVPGAERYFDEVAL